MLNKILFVIIIIFSAADLYAQYERIQSVGGMKYIIYDNYYSLNPFDLGGNPAWLYKDEKSSWLKMVPSYTYSSGDYRRRYDPSGESNYSVDFSGVKTLEEDGTFKGETGYLYNSRNSVPRSLKYNTYGGEAFFFADTTTGNFRYTGPQIKFSYSFEPVSGLSTGASVRYRILNGLKSIYSRAETMYRDVEGTIGAAYEITDNFVASINYTYSDDQEKIESASEDLLEVEVFNFRGDTYSVRRRSDTEQKITNKGNTTGVQLYYKPGEKTEIALTGTLGNNKQKILIPYRTTVEANLRLKEFEEGYSSFNDYNINLLSRFEVIRNGFIGFEGGYLRNHVWSKYSQRERLLWDWETKEIFGGAGASYQINPQFLVALEYSYSKQNADSSKYIDSRYVSLTSGNHLLKAGVEYKIFEKLTARAGYNIFALEKDLIYGGDNVKIHRITTGLGINLVKDVVIDLVMDYYFYKGLPAGLNRSGYSAYAGIRLNTF